MYPAYTLLSAAALVVMAPWLAWQALRHGKYRHAWQERLGRLPAALAGGRPGEAGPTLWLHAVSVGEVLGAAPLVAAIRRDSPTWRIVVSTTTRTGRAMAETRLPGIAGVFYFPLDFPWIVRRVLDHLAPSVVVVVETEIWPNLARRCRQQGIGLLLVNARISDRSYPRYRLARRWLARVLADFDRLCAQSDDTAERLRTLGAPADRVVVTGSLKFDVSSPAAAGVEAVAARLAGRPVLLAASTLKGEDELLLDMLPAIRQATSDALLVLAPRHPERFDAVTALAERTGLRVVRRTRLADAPDGAFDVLVLDTIGELASLCAQATVVFVGGSLVPAGGHNILEPARFGKAIVVGPSMSNFADITRTFLDAHALVQAPGADAVRREILDLFADPVRRLTLGTAAAGVLDRHRGAVDRTMQEVTTVMRAHERQAPIAVPRAGDAP